MKKIAIMIALVCIFSLNIKAQEKECIKSGTVLVDGYVGFINPYNFILKLQIIADYLGNATNIYTSPVGPIGVKGEYLITKLIGINGDFNYTNTNITFNYPINGNSNNPIQLYTWNAISTRAMLGINFHYVRKEKFEMYSGFRLGYFNRIITRTPNDRSYTNPQYNITPIGARIETGMRYFFIPNFGIHVSVGIGINGGQVFGVGLSGNF